MSVIFSLTFAKPHSHPVLDWL